MQITTDTDVPADQKCSSFRLGAQQSLIVGGNYAIRAHAREPPGEIVGG